MDILRNGGYTMVIGITGGIGTGKSTVLKILKEKHFFHVFEADRMGHEIMKPGMEAHKKIVNFFGTGVLKEDNFIDRKALGEIVFKDEEKLKILNGIIHPAVINDLEARIKRMKEGEPNANFVIEAALLIESGCYKICDSLWYIYSNDETRIERLKRERGYTEEQIRCVMANQLDNKEFMDKTDVTIDNSNSIEETEKQIEKILEF